MRRSNSGITGSNSSLLEMDQHAAVELEEAEASTARFAETPLGRLGLTNDQQEILLCAIFALICSVPSILGLSPRKRPIPVQQLQDGEYVVNLTNNEEFVGDTVPDLWLFFGMVLLPLVLQCAIAVSIGRIHDVKASVCVYLVAVGLTGVSTDLVKSYVSYLRPVFLDICQPDDNYEECTNENSADARKSFPSGHASLSLCCTMLLSQYLHNRFGLPSIRSWRPSNGGIEHGGDFQMIPSYRKDPLLYRFLSIFSLLPLAVALFVAASRVKDNRHFPADVVGGSVLGGSIAIFVHGLWL